MYKVYIDGKDLTARVGSLTWNDSIDTLATEVGFSLATSRQDDRFKQARDVTLGSTFQLVGTEGVVVEGVIVQENVKEKTTDFTAYDMAWYLNKSTVIKQFKKMQGNECVRSLCSELGIPVEVEGLEAIIDKIYKDKKVSDVIKDIITQSETAASKKIRMAFEEGKLKIKPYEKIVVKGKFELYRGSAVGVNEYLADVNLSRNINSLKNCILVVSGDKEAVRVEGQAEDPESIEKFGKIQDVIELDEQMFGKAELVAKNELKRLNRVTEDFKITILADDSVKSGKIIEIDLPLFNIKGEYLIRESSHSVSGGIHKAALTLEAYNG